MLKSSTELRTMANATTSTKKNGKHVPPTRKKKRDASPPPSTKKAAPPPPAPAPAPAPASPANVDVPIALMNMNTDEPPAVWVDVDKLVPWSKNPRRNEPSVETVIKSIRRFGWGAPLTARKANGEIIGGHTRIKAAQKLGIKRVPVRYMDLTEAEAHALAIADNKTNELAGWDEMLLAETVFTFDNLDGLGFDDKEIDLLRGLVEPKAQDLDLNYEIAPSLNLGQRQVAFVLKNEVASRVIARLEQVAKDANAKGSVGERLGIALAMVVLGSEDA